MFSRKYIIGSKGQIGGYIKQFSRECVFISRADFLWFLNEIEKFDASKSIYIVNCALLSNEDLYLLVSALNRSRVKCRLDHLSTVATNKSSEYACKKLYEENFLKASLREAIDFRIIKLGIPVALLHGRLRGFGYWSDILLRKNTVLLTTNSITIDLISFDDEFVVKSLTKSEVKNLFGIVWLNVLPDIRLVDVAPIRSLNRYLSNIRIQVCR